MGFQELCLLCYETHGLRHSGAARVTLTSTLIWEFFACCCVGNFQIWILSPKKYTERCSTLPRSICSTFCVRAGRLINPTRGAYLVTYLKLWILLFWDHLRIGLGELRRLSLLSRHVDNGNTFIFFIFFSISSEKIDLGSYNPGHEPRPPRAEPDP